MRMRFTTSLLRIRSVFALFRLYGLIVQRQINGSKCLAGLSVRRGTTMGGYGYKLDCYVIRQNPRGDGSNVKTRVYGGKTYVRSFVH